MPFPSFVHFPYGFYCMPMCMSNPSHMDHSSSYDTLLMSSLSMPLVLMSTSFLHFEITLVVIVLSRTCVRAGNFES